MPQYPGGLRLVISPDKFKGSLTAAQAAARIAAGALRADPLAETVEIPVADGGEGTLDAALGAGFARREVRVTGPVGEPVVAAYALRGAEAVVELAQASGLDVLPQGRRDARGATSRGTGELIAAALDAGARRIVLGVGGSASTDGGAGMLQALGVRLLDDRGAELPRGGAALARLASTDLADLDPRLAATELVLASDVDNELLGPNGAAAVFGPQKGATAEDVRDLDAALARFVDVLGHPAAAHRPGAGAAGGVGFAALVLGASRRPGIEVVLEFTRFAERLAGADAVITGEGSLDAQSLGGKTPIGVARAAGGIPVHVLCGRSELDPEQSAVFASVDALSELEPDPARSMAHAGELLEALAERVVRRIRSAHAGT